MQHQMQIGNEILRRTVEYFQDVFGNQISPLIVDYFRYQIFQINSFGPNLFGPNLFGPKLLIQSNINHISFCILTSIRSYYLNFYSAACIRLSGNFRYRMSSIISMMQHFLVCSADQPCFQSLLNGNTGTQMAQSITAWHPS